jgi:methyl-accepting chemotaxis protein
MECWKKVLTSGFIGLLIGAAVVFGIGYGQSKEFRKLADESQKNARAIEGRLATVQGNLERIQAGVGNIAEEVGGISDEIGRTAESIASATDGIDSVIGGLERSIEFIDYITGSIERLEDILAGIDY